MPLGAIGRLQDIFSQSNYMGLMHICVVACMYKGKMNILSIRDMFLTCMNMILMQGYINDRQIKKLHRLKYRRCIFARYHLEKSTVFFSIIGFAFPNTNERNSETGA